MSKLTNPNSRIDLADVLRGGAVVAIFLLHCIEHFNFYNFPEPPNEWVKFLNTAVWDTLFFTFAGKSYAVFAMLFGLSFFIQDRNQKLKGYTFRWRYIWRLLLLFMWGNLNASFFMAEVLVLFSLVGFVLLLVNPLKDRTIAIIAIIFMLQPVEVGKVIYAVANPDYELTKSLSSIYFSKAASVLSGDSFLVTLKSNLTDGQIASLAWAWSNGRFFQTASLFMIGLLVGRKGLFNETEGNIKRFVKIGVISLICFFPLEGIHNMLPGYIENKAILVPLKLIFSSLYKFAFMCVLVSAVALAFYKTKYRSFMMKIAPYGKMSLTNYIVQSIVGAFIFYGWGLGLYQHLGIASSALVGVVLVYIQCKFSTMWMSTHRYGPLEGIWHKLTWIGRK